MFCHNYVVFIVLVENQIACSRLLNLTLSTLATDNFSNESKIESLNFIADVIYENGIKFDSIIYFLISKFQLAGINLN